MFLKSEFYFYDVGFEGVVSVWEFGDLGHLHLVFVNQFLLNFCLSPLSGEVYHLTTNQRELSSLLCRQSGCQSYGSKYLVGFWGEKDVCVGLSCRVGGQSSFCGS